MADLEYILTLGFSGTDVWHAVLLAFVGGMFVSKKSSLWTMAFWALIIDRIIWPLAAQAMAGAEIHSTYASIGALFQTFPNDIGLYVIRYFGIVTMMGVFVYIRYQIHRPFMKKKSKSATA